MSHDDRHPFDADRFTEGFTEEPARIVHNALDRRSGRFGVLAIMGSPSFMGFPGARYRRRYHPPRAPPAPRARGCV